MAPLVARSWELGRFWLRVAASLSLRIIILVLLRDFGHGCVSRDASGVTAFRASAQDSACPETMMLAGHSSMEAYVCASYRQHTWYAHISRAICAVQRRRNAAVA